MLNFQAKRGKSRRDHQQLPVTEGPLIDLCDLEQRGTEAEETRPETDAERLAKLKVRRRTHYDTCHVMIQAIRETLRQAQHQINTRPGQGATGHNKSKGESYR